MVAPSQAITDIEALLPCWIEGGVRGELAHVHHGRRFEALGAQEVDGKAPPAGDAVVRAEETIFRLFAPRAKHVRLFVCERLADAVLLAQVFVQRFAALGAAARSGIAFSPRS